MEGRVCSGDTLAHPAPRLPPILPRGPAGRTCTCFRTARFQARIPGSIWLPDPDQASYFSEQRECAKGRTLEASHRL
jgi:hypothetical protein